MERRLHFTTTTTTHRIQTNLWYTTQATQAIPHKPRAPLWYITYTEQIIGALHIREMNSPALGPRGYH